MFEKHTKELLTKATLQLKCLNTLETIIIRIKIFKNRNCTSICYSKNINYLKFQKKALSCIKRCRFDKLENIKKATVKVALFFSYNIFESFYLLLFHQVRLLFLNPYNPLLLAPKQSQPNLCYNKLLKN